MQDISRVGRNRAQPFIGQFFSNDLEVVYLELHAALWLKSLSSFIIKT